MCFINASYGRGTQCALAWFATCFFSAVCIQHLTSLRTNPLRIRKAYYYHNHFPRQFAAVFTMTTGLIPLNITKPSVEGLLNAHQITVIVC